MSSKSKTWTLIAACLGTFVLLLDVTIVAVALPSIQTSLGGTFADVQWTIDAYSLSLAAVLLPSGAMADLFGRRLLFVIGIALFTLGSALCGGAASTDMLVASRGLQGIGGAIVFATSLALLAQTFHGRERGTAFGVWGAVAGVATALGPIVGGVLTTTLGWRSIFWVNVPLGIATIAITLRYVEESRLAERHRIDAAGMVVFATGLVALVYGLIRAGEGWGQTTVVASFVIAAVALVAFPIVEARVPQPMFDLSLFRKPTFVGGSIAALGMNGSLFAMIIFIVLYLQRGLGYSPLDTGLRLLVCTGATLLVAIPAGKLTARIPVRWLLGPGLVLVGAGLWLMRGADATWTHFIPGFIVAGVGSGIVNPALASTAVGVVEPSRAGVASGMNTTFRQVGIATSVAALGTLLAHRMAGPPSRVTFAHAIDRLFMVSAAIAVVAGVLAFALVRQRDLVQSRRP